MLPPALAIATVNVWRTVAIAKTVLVAFGRQSDVYDLRGGQCFTRRRIKDQAAGIWVWRVGLQRRNQSVDIDDTAAGGHNMLDQLNERVAVKFF